LHHLVDRFKCDEEKDLSGQGNDGSLLGNVVGLALESELWESVDPREEVKG
jgi:hypothetical protein